MVQLVQQLTFGRMVTSKQGVNPVLRCALLSPLRTSFPGLLRCSQGLHHLRSTNPSAWRTWRSSAVAVHCTVHLPQCRGQQQRENQRPYQPHALAAAAISAGLVGARLTAMDAVAKVHGQRGWSWAGENGGATKNSALRLCGCVTVCLRGRGLGAFSFARAGRLKCLSCSFSAQYSSSHKAISDQCFISRTEGG